LQEGASNGTVNRELTIIRRAFNLGLQTGRVARGPYLPLLKENNVRQGFFEPAAFKNLLWHLPNHTRQVTRFTYVTGWRRSEVLRLQWKNRRP